MDLLLEFTQAQSSNVSEAVPKLKESKGLLEKVGGQVDALDRKVLQLWQRIKTQDKRIETLEKNASKSAGDKDKRQQRVLLGQAAYALAKIIEQYVYGPAGFPHGLGLPVSLNNIDKDSANLLPDQKSRWEAVQLYCSSFMPFEELLRIDKELRLQRSDIAHGNNAENAKTALLELTTWAGVHFQPQAVMPVQSYVQVLNNFSSRNRPLVPDVEPVQVFQNVQR